MNRATVTPLEARCAHCHDTGSLSKWTGGDMDCTHCDTAEKRSAMYATVEAARKVAMSEYRLASFDAVWFAYQLGQAAPVAAQPALPKLPGTPLEVTSFIGDRFDEWKSADSVEDYRYTISVHDLLSAFQAYEDAQPADPDTCRVDEFSSRGCELGTKGCIIYHAAPAVVAAPKGYTLVPNSPNEEMLRPDGFSYRLGYDQYQAMLAAAPAIGAPVEVEPILWAALNLNGKIVYSHESRENVDMNRRYIKTPTTIVGLAAIATGDKRE